MKAPLILFAAISALNASAPSTQELFDNPRYWIDIPIQRKPVIETVSAKEVTHHTVRDAGDYFSSIHISPDFLKPSKVTFEQILDTNQNRL